MSFVRREISDYRCVELKEYFNKLRKIFEKSIPPILYPEANKNINLNLEKRIE